MQNKLYKCAHLAWAALGSQQGVLKSQWQIAEEYRALDAKCSAREILSLLSSEAVRQCCICPEQYEYIPVDQKFFFQSTADKNEVATST